jgi:type II secretory pathway pseudopilin PulG
MLTLLLMVALLIISFSVAASSISFEIKRDREEEMIHRGVQYSRAIRSYYKKFGRYPTRLEDLENTNNLRFLRKRYKDPITGKDFKLLHFGEVKLTFSPLAGATPVSGMTSMNSTSSSFGSSSSSSFGSSSGFSGSSFSSGFGRNSASTDTSQPGNSASTSSSTDTQSAQGTESSQTQVSAYGASDTSSGSQTVFGGGPIVGVASISKEQTIREFNHKRKYNEWQFIYDPASDRGGLLMTPNQPPLMQGFNNLQNANQPQNSSSPFSSQPSGSGSQPSGFGNNSSFGSGPGNTMPPTQNPPQQQ